jgi:hypothetical protein
MRKQRKTQEAYSENLIPELFFRNAFITSFVGVIMVRGQSRCTTAYNWWYYLYLTDSVKPKNASEQHVNGDIIGYAHRNNSRGQH